MQEFFFLIYPLIHRVFLFFRNLGTQSTKKVLDDISFALLPFEATVLLGGPRSGKTSLFECIAQRRTEGVTGTITVKDHPPGRGALDPAPLGSLSTSIFLLLTWCFLSDYQRMVSYVMQGDVHNPLLTVRETFEFAAACQLPNQDAVKRRVDIVLQLLGLSHVADTLVGGPTHRGVSGGERRRVSIGTEWLKNPSFFLLDEPTSGLVCASSSS